jgi:endogenous inhibitor of DNA gyrase (YacG/DUF329 family)
VNRSASDRPMCSRAECGGRAPDGREYCSSTCRLVADLQLWLRAEIPTTVEGSARADELLHVWELTNHTAELMAWYRGQQRASGGRFIGQLRETAEAARRADAAEPPAA